MNLLFYFFGFFSIFFTILIVFNKNPIYSLLYLILSLLSVSGIFFIFGALFIGALEIIIYAGAIMVLFIFILMLINPEIIQEKKKNNRIRFFFYFLIFVILLGFLHIFFISENKKIIFIWNVSIKKLGILLFGKYLLLVELTSLLLLSSVLLSCFFFYSFFSFKNLNKKDKN